jgi:uncharacterized membrane protein
MIKKLIAYFFAGLVTILPITIFIWLIFYVVNFCMTYLNLESTIIGILIVLLGLIPLGYIVKTYLGGKVWNDIEKRFYRIPVLGQIYKALQDITKSIVGSENKFTEPVIAELSEGCMYKIGFVTNKDLTSLIGNHEFGKESSGDMCLVYFPISFSLAGDLFLVPKSKLKPIDRNNKAIMQTIISGGIIEQDYAEGVEKVSDTMDKPK